ncbi:putative ribonuclease H-like domain-containing protein [Tanacetum coccineum]
MAQKLGNGFEFKKKACFVCGSLNHLIKDYNFYENKMVRKSVLNNVRRATGQREVRPSGNIPVNTTKQSSLRASISNSTARYVNTAASRPIVNGAKPSSNVIHKSYSSVKRTFYQRTTPKNNDFKEKVNTAKIIKTLMEDLLHLLEVLKEKNSVLFTETECLVLSPDFKLLDESQVLLKVPRQNNMYSFDLKNIVPSGGLTCLIAKATIDESNLWHRRLGHINFKSMYKLVRGNLVRGLPSKLFENDHSCVACEKDETSGILKTFITGIENQINHKVKIIRCDNGTEFKNNDLNQFCGMKGIKREFSIAKTPQQNGVAERNIRSLIENRVLVTKPHNKTPYELLLGRPPYISFMRPFGCPVTILNTLDPLGKFNRKADEGFLVGYC